MNSIDLTGTEINKLYDVGFRRILTTNEFRKTLNNGDYQTVIKWADDSFDYSYDVNDSAEDIDRANSGISEYGLTWDEMWELL